MTAVLQDPLLFSLREYLQEHLGLNIPRRQEADLIRKLGKAAKDFGFSNPDGFMKWLVTARLSPEQTGLLASHLTVGETYFMREKKGFDFLEQIYLPGLIHKRSGAARRLRVWCAGCATGEEAYSLAIVLLQSIPDIQHWDISILATDINPQFLEKARAGIYSKWSFRNQAGTIPDSYFQVKGPNEFHIHPRIRQMVSFASLNLATEDFPSRENGTGELDIIFCRNVLIYFSPEGITKLTEKYYHALAKGGILVVSPVEISALISTRFDRINYGGFTIYHKGSHKAEGNATPSVLHPLPAIPHQPPEKVKAKGAKEAGRELDRLKRLLPVKPAETEGCPSGHPLEKATLLFEQGSVDEAESLLAAPVSSNLTHGKPAFYLLARIKANLGKLKEAKEACNQAIRLDKLDPGLYYLLATIHHELGEDEQAIHLLNRAVYLDPDFVLARFLLGSLWMKAGIPESGRKSFRRALVSLDKFPPDEILPESDGITAGRFKEILSSIRCR